MYFGELLILSRYGCQKGINLLMQHTVCSQGHSSSRTDMQRALACRLNHIHISKECQWPPWQMKHRSSDRQQINVCGVITNEGYGERICAVYQLMLLQGGFFFFSQKVNSLILSACRIRSILVQGRLSWPYGGWAESWQDMERGIFNERFDDISGRWDHKSAFFSGFVIMAMAVFISCLFIIIYLFFFFKSPNL